MFSTGLSSGARDGSRIGVMFFGMLSFPVVCQPARSSSSTACAPFATWREISSRWSCIISVSAQRRALAFGRAYRAEEVGVFVALVGRLARTCSASRPLPHEAVLLADARFVLEPDFDRRLRRKGGQMRLQ